MTKMHERRAAEITAVLLLGAISFQLTSCSRSSAGAGEKGRLTAANVPYACLWFAGEPTVFACHDSYADDCQLPPASRAFAAASLLGTIAPISRPCPMDNPTPVRTAVGLKATPIAAI